MNKTEGESSEWRTVTKSSKRRVAKQSRWRKKVPPKASISISISSSLSLDEIEQGLESCLQELNQSSFFQNFRNSLSSLYLSQSISTIICYGVGNFGVNRTSAPMWQLSCAIALRSFLTHAQSFSSREEEGEEAKRIEMLYFDPCMTQNEAIILERNSIHVIPNNERGKRHVGIMDSTLFYMPHCPMSLYTNVLHTNWDNLERVVIFGNSPSAYANRLEVNSNVKFLQLLEPHWEEESVSMTKEDIVTMTGYFEQAFNDSSITLVPKKREGTKWPERPPKIDNDDDGGETI